ncbi:MAG: polysaccharide biosynthesis tyrosine autokinase [Caldithrix sp.]|nr:polysaccharide biosynthesis tyrosine autokinase [Caldithrix sp.]
MEYQFDPEQEEQVNLSEYLRILYRGKWIIAIAFIAVIITTIYYTYSTAPVYQATTSIMIEPTGAMQRSFFDMNRISNQNTFIANQIEILKSRKLAERVISRLERSDVRDSLSLFKPNEEGKFLSLRAAVGSIRGRMEVEPKRDTDIITVSYQAGTPFEASYITNTIAEEFQNLNAEASQSEVTEMRDFIEDRLSIKEKELRLSEERLRDYKEKNQMTGLDEEANELVTRVAEVESKLEEARVDLQANQEMKKSLQGQIKERRDNFSSEISSISTPYLTSLQQQLAQAVAEKTVYTTAIESEQNINKRNFQGKIKQYDERINALRNKLKEEAAKISQSNMIQDPLQLTQELINRLLTVEAEIKATTAKISTLQEIVSEYNKRLQNLPDKVLQLARLERRRQVDEQTFIMLTQKLEEAKIQVAAKKQNVRIIDEAIEPNAPVKPNKRLNLMLGALIGLGLGVGITFLMEYMDTTIRRVEELERIGFNILANIPVIEEDKLEKKVEKQMSTAFSNEARKVESRLITHFDPKSPVSEAYRTLRTNLQFSKIDRRLQNILITSSGPKEGKSTTAANLAIAMAQAGQKVILLDADLRRPIIHFIFGHDKEIGLTNYLMDTVSLDEIMLDTFDDNLKIITSGVLPPNPSELLGSAKMENLLEKLKTMYDIIVVDSPPVIAVTDAAILSAKVDGTLMVVSFGQTNNDALKRAHGLLDNVGGNLLGAVFNGVRVESGYGSKSYYYYYYQYYGKSGRRKQPKKSRLF